MNIVIVGCGKIGSAILANLANENHNITVVDNDVEVVEQINNVYDVKAVCGSATSRSLLEQAGVGKADLFISVTERDEVNMLSCLLAKKLGAQYTVARVSGVDYTDEAVAELIKDLDLAMVVNPDKLTAETIFNSLKMPSAIKVDTFAGKKVQIMEIIVRDNSALENVLLSDLRQKCAVPFIVCAIKRGDEVFVPTGACKLLVGDKVAIMVKSADTHKLLKIAGLVNKQSKDVILLGGSQIAYYLAKMLTANNYHVKIVEKDKERCAKLSETLNETTIIYGDATKQELLLEEGIGFSDAIVTLTGKDEENILLSFFAISQNVPKAIAKINSNHLVVLAEQLGLNSTTAPRRIVADVLTRYARALNATIGSKVETMYSLLDGKAEALEFVVLADCEIANQPFKQLQLKPNCIVAGIIRGSDTIIPSGDDFITQGDKVIVVATDLHLGDVSDIVK